MAKKHLTDLKCKSTIYLTPARLLDPVKNYFGGSIPLDPATEPSNPTGAGYYGTEEGEINDRCLGDGLLIDWHRFDGTFVNPPYGRVIKDWCRKIHEESDLGAAVIALLPAGPRFSTQYFQDHIFTSTLTVACFVRGRVKFLRPDGTVTTGQNPYDSVLYGFNIDKDRFEQEFKHLGSVVMMCVL